ncbi:MAG: heme/copper-type cytochrome/quinol oxidase, subunit 1 [Thermoleophilia bacterium]|nr:heme/copper-type cytochrome/quinol oxidase, subunit 1 [Thermoleophilia bacterium]
MTATPPLPVTRAEQLRRLPTRTLRLTRADGRLVNAHVITAFVALLLGGVAGLLQSLEHSGRVPIPFGMGYYQLLTAHGILMALVFTTFFILGFFHSGMAVSMDGELEEGPRMLAWTGYLAMVAGCIFVIVPLLHGTASVLYTFYAPMQASPWFYVGLALFVVGSWIGGAAIFVQYASWRRANGARTTPLFSFMAVATMLMWQVASLGVAVEVLFQLIPWSFRWVDRVDVLLSRTLFWFFGHPLVYFWLMPAYVAWYLVMPKLIGGRVFSDNLARLSFLLLLMFSVPVGLHHQLQEPGVDPHWKLVQVGLTMAVVIPSLMTAFALWATMEQAGRERGFGGWFGWLRALPWRDARFVALFWGMFTFIPGGAGGLILASFDLNQVAHNTIFVTGHFHLTVATAVALTFIGTAYWLVPHAAGRRITPRVNRLMLVQVYTWVVGMAVMSGAMHIVGLLGAPRRTKWINYGPKEDLATSWVPYEFAMAIGGTVLFVSVLLAVGIVFHLLLRAPRETKEEPRAEYPLADPPRSGLEVPRWLERWRWWTAALVFLVVAAYVGPVMSMLRDPAAGAKPVKSYFGDEGGSRMPVATEAAAGEPAASGTAPLPGVGGTEVKVRLGEDGGKLYVRPAADSVAAGTVTFSVRNKGSMPHELVVLKTDLDPGKLPEGDGGKAKEVGRVAHVPQMTPGSATQYVTLDLKPGKYVLLCNVPGHYGLGQYAAFTVT